MMIHVENVCMDYVIERDRTKSLKEYLIRVVKRKNEKATSHVLKDVSFDVSKGEVMGIIGSNGAGKSTLLKIISGILKPTRGTVTVNGSIAPMLELGSGMDTELSGRENIFLNGSILGFSKKYLTDRFDEIVDFSELGDYIDVPVRNYSSGMVMRLAFSIATMIVPDVLIVDEILAVGDDRFQAKSKKRMIDLMHGGTTVLFVSHSLDQISEMCDRVVWLDHGVVKACGDTKKICGLYRNRE